MAAETTIISAPDWCGKLGGSVDGLVPAFVEGSKKIRKNNFNLPGSDRWWPPFNRPFLVGWCQCPKSYSEMIAERNANRGFLLQPRRLLHE
jgi:hypothetical protein